MKILKKLKKNGIYYGVKSIFLQLLIKKLNKKVVIFNSSFNENYNFNTRYLFEYFLTQKEILKQYEIKFIINDDEKRENLNKLMGNHFIEGKSFKGIIYILKAQMWITSTIDPPILSLFINKNRIVYHLGHGIPLKNIIMAEEGISLLKKINRYLRVRNFTHALVTSDFIKGVIENAFRNKKMEFIVMGQPRNDNLFIREPHKLENYLNVLSKEEKYILYSPTWRPYENTKIFPFMDFSIEDLNQFLDENKITICVRKHPYYDIEIPKEIKKSKRIQYLNNDKISDIMPYLNQFSGLITDYSSIYLDFLLLDLPMIFINNDQNKYEEIVGFSFDYDLHTPGPKVKTQLNFINELYHLLKDETYFRKERDKVNLKINENKYENCKKNSEFILSLIK